MENPIESLTSFEYSESILVLPPPSLPPPSPFIMNTEAKQFIQSIPIHHILPDTDPSGSTVSPRTAFSGHPYVAWVHNGDSVDSALSTCAAFRISACPVWNESIKKCIGLIDLNDIVALVVRICDQVLGPNLIRSISSGDATLKDEQITQMSKLWLEEKVENVINLSGRNPMIPLPYFSTVFDAVELLAQGIHRMPLLSANNDDIVAIISQSLILQFLADNLDKLGDKPKLLIHQILDRAERAAAADPAVRNPYTVISVAEDTLVIDAFRTIHQERVTGVAVLDAKTRYRMAGVLSASDIKSVIVPGEGFHPSLFGTVAKLLKFIQENNDVALGPIVAVTPIDTLGMAVTKLVDNGVHRVFVVRAHQAPDHRALLGNVPMSVLSPTDILLELLRE